MSRDANPSRARTSPGDVRAVMSTCPWTPWLAELEEFPARLLLGLPCPVTFWLDVPGAPVPVCITTAATAHTEPVLASAIVFDRDELGALLDGVESERVWRRELLGLCFEKWRRPSLRIAPADTLAGAQPDAHARAWSVRQVIARLGASITRIELADGQAAHALPVAA